MSEVREAVRRRCGGVALELAGDQAICCGPASAGGCGGTYAAGELAGQGLGEGISQGCGNPDALVELEPGDYVLDLGSGGGLDVLLAAWRVGPEGHAYGVDMTDEMLTLASRNRERAGIENATCLEGTIEPIPLPNASVDVVISNRGVLAGGDEAGCFEGIWGRADWQAGMDAAQARRPATFDAGRECCAHAG